MEWDLYLFLLKNADGRIMLITSEYLQFLKMKLSSHQSLYILNKRGKAKMDNILLEIAV